MRSVRTSLVIALFGVACSASTDGSDDDAPVVRRVLGPISDWPSFADDAGTAAPNTPGTGSENVGDGDGITLPSVDAGSPVESLDGGVPPRPDASTSVDAGAPGEDAATPDEDAATPDEDAGCTQSDADAGGDEGGAEPDCDAAPACVLSLAELCLVSTGLATTGP